MSFLTLRGTLKLSMPCPVQRVDRRRPRCRRGRRVCQSWRIRKGISVLAEGLNCERPV